MNTSMKPSAFNVVATRVDESGMEHSVVFNAFTGAFAQVDASISEALVPTSIGTGAIDILDTLEGEEIQLLSTKGFLVPDGLDEFGDFERMHLKDMNQTDFLSLCIAPTLQCNLRCLYCYEEHENVTITPQVEDAIMRFIERRYDAYEFKQLRILWYGGEPLLELDAIERLSQRMIAWANEHNIEYLAQIITNATLIDDETARRMASMRIGFAMPTLDGCASCHDKRRIHIDGSGSFAETEAGIRALSDAGIEVGVSSNLDATALEGYRELEASLRSYLHVDAFASHLRPYNDWATDERLQQGDFDVLTRDGFAKAQFELYAEQHPPAESVYQTLRARRSFCQGKMASYFVIDPEGNVYRCDGRMRNSDYILFNILEDGYPLDWPETKTLSENNERCKDCALVPICLGQCDWEWDQFSENCTPAKYVIDDYLWLLHDALDPAMTTTSHQERITVLIEPRDMSQFFATPLREKGLME